jgi:hypothetical protein
MVEMCGSLTQFLAVVQKEESHSISPPQGLRSLSVITTSTFHCQRGEFGPDNNPLAAFAVVRDIEFYLSS